jgi:hypothetical protein
MYVGGGLWAAGTGSVLGVGGHLPHLNPALLQDIKLKLSRELNCLRITT